MNEDEGAVGLEAAIREQVRNSLSLEFICAEDVRGLNHSPKRSL